MNNGVIFVIVGFVFLVILFGIYAVNNVKKQDDEALKKKNEWADSEVDLISNKSTKV